MTFSFDLTLLDGGEPDVESLRSAILAQCQVFGGANDLSLAYDREQAQVICRLVPAQGRALGRLMRCFSGTGINGAIYFNLPVDAPRPPPPQARLRPCAR